MSLADAFQGAAGTGMRRRTSNARASARAQGQPFCSRRTVRRPERVIRLRCARGVVDRLPLRPRQLESIDEEDGLGPSEQVGGGQGELGPHGDGRPGSNPQATDQRRQALPADRAAKQPATAPPAPLPGSSGR